jgi:AcrR family transcriptional regulator
VETQWSPNRLAKRQVIIEAASSVIRSQGIAACTARAIADASPLTTSSLHYYFNDVDEIVDLAFLHVMTRFIDGIQRAAEEADSTVDALWVLASSYLERGSAKSQPNSIRGLTRAPMIWFEYQVMVSRRGDMRVAVAVVERLEALFQKYIEATGVSEPYARAQALFSALLGSAVRDVLHHRDVNEVLHEIALVCGLPSPGTHTRR